MFALDLDFVHTTNTARTHQASDLVRCAEMLSHNPLSHLSLSHTEEFAEWLLLMTAKLQVLQSQIIKKISEDETLSPQTIHKWVRVWARQESQSFDAAHAL